MQADANIHLGKLVLYGDLILSPMDGFSDAPFRAICRRLGSAASYTEFINAVDIENKHPFIKERLRFTAQERPVFFQLLDNSVDRLVKVAVRLREEWNPDAIDINLGCCARSVVSRGAGASLLREPRLVGDLFHRLSQVLDVPITAKIRLGWDHLSRNYVEIAKILEDNGCNLIAVHGRTRAQQYQGAADWDAIAEVKRTVSIPVVGNGDVLTVSDIDRMKQHTDCDAIMIGRGAIRNPWIFGRIDRQDVSLDVVYKSMLEQLAEMISFFGEPLGIMRFRKFANGYLKIYELEKESRRELLTCLNKEQFADILKQIMTTLSK